MSTAEEKFYHEINAFKIEGRAFSFAARKKRGEVVTVDVEPPSDEEILRQLEASDYHQEGAVWTTPNPLYGQPGELAYKAFQVILKKVSDIGPSFDGSIHFSYRELAAMCGRGSIGGKDLKELYRAIDQLLSTKITCAFHNKRRKKWRVIKFSLLIGEEYETSLDEPSRGRGSVMLHPYIVSSLRERYSFSLNYERLQALPDALSQALYKRLHYHFANMYQHHTREAFPPFVKSYDDICRDWFSGLSPLTNRKHILERQLGKHLERLAGMGFLSSYDIEKNKAGTGFNFVCNAGPTFFDDYARLNSVAGPQELPTPTTAPESELVAYFYAKKYGTTEAAADVFIPRADLEFARQVLAKLNSADAQAFVDFALIEAGKTNFDVRMLSGLVQYHAPFLAHLQERTRRRIADEARCAQEQADSREQKLVEAYQAFRKEQIELMRSRLDPRELALVEAEMMAQERVLRKTTIGLARMVQIRVDNHLAESNAIPSFEEWKSRELE